MRSRRTVVLLALVGAAALLSSVTLTWITAEQLGDTAALETVEVSGSQASDTVTAMGLVALAAAVTLTIARRFGRWLIAALMCAAAAAGLFAALNTIADPASAAASAVGEATGMTRTAGSYDLGIGPWIAAAGAALVMIAAVLVFVNSHRWPDQRSTKKYSRAANSQDSETGQEDPDEFDLWDGLSQGEDPTDHKH